MAVLQHLPAKLQPSAHTVATIHHFSTKFLITPTDVSLDWLSLHTHIAYLVLFLGSYVECFVGPSFFLPGELFLLPGAILAGAGTLNIWFVTAVLLGGAILGDSTSYWIGRAIGTSIFHERKKFLNFTNYHKIEKLLDKYGNSAIFFARFIPPFPKIAPVAAGIFEVPYPTFLLYNIPGIVIAMGQAIAVGYFFGNQYELIFWTIERYTLLLIFAGGLILFIYLYLKKNHKNKHKKHTT